MDSITGYFTDDEYGLLNAAKFALNKMQFNATTDVIKEYPSLYSNFQVIFLAMIMTAMMIIIVVGNMLVVIAIATENNLTNVQNWFIASLAVADMLIGLIVMPFSLAHELMGYWMFGEVYCEIHAAVDVLLCTASIMNICLIALDRYWSITRAIDYLNARTPAKVTLMIITVWILSGLISIPPLLGWKQDQDLTWFTEILYEQGNRTQIQFIQDLQESGRMNMDNFTNTLELVVYPQCGLSQDLGYVLYSAFGSFYIPSCIMVFVYIKIYYAARDRARRNIAHKRGKLQKKSEGKKKKHSKADRKRNAKKRAKNECLVNNGKAIPLYSSSALTSLNKKVEDSPVSIISEKVEIKDKESDENTLSSSEVHLPLPCGTCSAINGTKSRRSIGVSTYEDTNFQMMVGGTGSPKDTIERRSSSDSGPNRCIKLTSRYFKTPYFIGGKRRSSKETRQVIDTGKTKMLKSQPNSFSSSSITKSLASPSNIPPPSYPIHETEADREKKRIARKKERRATLILGLIMGSFIACWFPFFFLYSIGPICPKCEESENIDDSEPYHGCCVMSWGFSFAFWLGYSNSALNPVIYTVFNKDFRRAFKRILFK